MHRNGGLGSIPFPSLSAAQHPASIIPDEGQGAAQDGDDDSGSGVGELLGWLMAAIYMGGRVPQIYLNVRLYLLVPCK